MRDRDHGLARGSLLGLLGQSLLCLTDQRVLRRVNGGQWNLYPYSAISRLDLSGDRSGVIVGLKGKETTPFMYRVPAASVWFALFKHLVAPQTALQLNAGSASAGGA